jgi:hypothetical protein
MALTASRADETAMPKNGVLSGMAITYGIALLALGTGLLLPSVRAVLMRAPSAALLDGMLLSIAVMAVHKAECWWRREYEVCPVYITAARGRDGRETLFIGFVITFLAMMAFVYLVLLGPPWPLLMLAVWIAQGLHEIHHAAKSVAARRYYPGTATALLFVGAIDVFVFPRWLALVDTEPRLWFWAFYAAQPILFAAFVLEHQRWLRKTTGR